MTTTEMAGRLDARLALHGIHAPRASRVLAQLLVVMIGVAFVLLIVTPWQQNIAGSGRVIAFNPEERPQGGQPEEARPHRQLPLRHRSEQVPDSHER